MPALGYICVKDRTQAQHDAHDAARQHMVKFSLPVPKLATGKSIRLFDAWSNSLVVADVGLTWTRIHQQTGSCVWAGGTNASFSTIAMQRLVSDEPTKAFLPFTLANYAMSRHYMGSDRQGEGSLGSTFAKSLTVDGVRDWAISAGLPEFKNTDGIEVTSHVEYAWSSIHNPGIQAVLEASRPHLFGSAAECRSTNDIAAMIGSGYGVSFACDRFVGNAEIVGEGADAVLVGHWDSNGGHQQSIHAVWEHPTLGPLFWAQQNYYGTFFNRDPAGGPVCGCWVTEDNVSRALTYDAEVYGYSHLSWFPAQVDRVADFSKF